MVSFYSDPNYLSFYSDPNYSQLFPQLFDPNYSLEGCLSAGTVSQTARADIKLKVRPNAARCFKVDVQAGTTNPEVRITLMHDDKDLLKQLYIGLLDGTDVRPADVRSYVDDQPPHFATWTFPIFFGNRDVYILTNVAKFPAATREIKETFHIATGDWTSTMACQTRRYQYSSACCGMLRKFNVRAW